LKVRSYAKVNLSLLITGRDEKDGYHFIDSLFDPVSLYDVLDIKRAKPGVISVIDVKSALNIPPEKNIVYKAAVKFFEAAKLTGKAGAIIKLTKNIPNGAGLGGGSSNAAAVLLALNRMFKAGLSQKKLHSIAFQLGSDVPFFIYGKTARVRGKGEKISFIKRKKRFWYVLLCLPVHVSTQEAYKILDDYTGQNHLTQIKYADILITEMIKGWQIKKRGAKRILHNDFEKPVFSSYPELKKAKDALIKYNCIDAQLSGSGATVFGLFKSQKEALECAKGVRREFPAGFVKAVHSV